MKLGLRRILLALLLVTAGSSALGVAGVVHAANQVRDVQLWSAGESTRVVLQFDAAGHWLVTADTPITTDTPDVDD